ncbi:MAG: tRNA 2-thiouridine(34) synthase MnmA [Patescibacteria group bacterium]
MKSMVKKFHQKTKVLICMSGGVDSSVAAALLLRQGYDVTGAFMVNYDSGRAPVGDSNCWLPEYRDALRVAAHLGIPLLKLDFTKEYSEKVLKYMFREYKKGRTPNPDVLCNTFIKFGVWLDWAKRHGFEKLATGHYARLGREIRNPKHEIRNKSQIQNPKFELVQAKDKNKDQTYFLHQLNQEQLSHVLFPIGEFTKPQVRSLARRFGLPTANKEESMGICFVGEVPMKEFLGTKIKTKMGRMVTTRGEVIGKHDGLAFYTIGQRHLKISNDKIQMSNQIQNPSVQTRPLFVVGKNVKKNELIVGYEDDPALHKKEIIVTDVHWVGGQAPKFPLHCEVRLRHRQALQKAIIKCQMSGVKCQVSLDTPQRAPTPGQFAVFYKEEKCLGGGVIR